MSNDYLFIFLLDPVLYHIFNITVSSYKEYQTDSY
jgi:hypothetical protein